MTAARGAEHADIPQWHRVLMPLDMVADEPRMWRFARQRAVDKAHAWGVGASEVSYHWAFASTLDAATGRQRFERWDLDSPPPAWAYQLALVLTGPSFTEGPTA